MGFSASKLLHKFDWILFISILLLLGLSLAVLYPISQGSGGTNLDQSNFSKQLMFSGIGLVLFFALSLFDYRNLKNYSNYLFWGGIVILVLVLFFGKVIRGTTGWIGLGDLRLQPVEPFKVIAVVILAKYFSIHSRSLGNFRHIPISLVPIILSVALVLIQPDLGSAIILIFIWLTVLFISGIDKKHLLVLGLIGIITCIAMWGFFLKDYQRERIETVFNPSADPQGAGYNVLQSTVAVGSGGLWGKGLGHGSQSQLNFLPEKHSDFIFAVISEELGLGGALFTFALLLIVLARFVRTARNSRDNFGKLLAGGLAGIIFVQSLINIGMNIGLVPVAGIPLPFLSYGGSSLVTILVASGIVESVHRMSRV